MPASSGQQFRKAQPRSAIRRLKSKLGEDNSDQNTEEGEFSNWSLLREANDSATSHILKKPGDVPRSKLVDSVAHIIEKIAKDSHHRKVSQKRSEFQQTVERELSELVRFGPIYGVDTDANQKAKESAWTHIVQKTSPDADTLYKRAVRNIEGPALDSYDIPLADKPKPKLFRSMMVRDGCFFLQRALHILGGGDLLEYPPNNPYFGSNIDSTSSIPAMFFVGNQIPYNVIRALMKETFFKNVIDEGIKKRTWQPPPENNYAKLVLYMTVVEPELERPSFFSKLIKKPPPHFIEPPSNILEGLHNLFVGTTDHDPKYSEMKDFHDLEAGNEDDDIRIPSAGELYKLGIRLRSTGSSGIRKIRFRNLGYCAKLYLPTLTIDKHTKHILTSLLNHEQTLRESDREVTAYLRFMRDLLRTYKDFKILEDKKIIEVKEEDLKGSTVLMLDDLVTVHKSNFTLNFRQIRQKITDYGGPPWRLISIILGVLAIIQTIFTVLSYILPPK